MNPKTEDELNFPHELVQYLTKLWDTVTCFESIRTIDSIDAIDNKLPDHGFENGTMKIEPCIGKVQNQTVCHVCP